MCRLVEPVLNGLCMGWSEDGKEKTTESNCDVGGKVGTLINDVNLGGMGE